MLRRWDTKSKERARLFMHEHERWLKIVKEDLAAAKVLLKAELFSSVAYHSQQTALYSEDMHHWHLIDGKFKIINPFHK